MISRNVPLYYGWVIVGASGFSSVPQNENVVCVSPRIYRNYAGYNPYSIPIEIAVQDTAINGKTPDGGAAGVEITVK
jgi:hypothetical protein